MKLIREIQRVVENFTRCYSLPEDSRIKGFVRELTTVLGENALVIFPSLIG